MTTPIAKVFAPVTSIYAPSPEVKPIEDPSKIESLYKHWRFRMLASMFVGYGILYFGRKNISAALPILGTDLGYTNLQLGILGSTLYVTYGIGKFLNGILADRSNIRTFMATGLILSGFCNLWFGSLTSIWALAFAWGMNGWVQSMGFPPIARGLTIWYETKGKATRWALWTTSHQAGTAAILALTGLILYHSNNNWRLCFSIPGVICIIVGIGLLFSLADTPQSKGLPKTVSFAEDAIEEKQPYWDVFFRRVLLNRQLWVIALVNLCVYIVRYGTLDWMTKFLVENKGYQISTAAGMASTMPLFGIGGVLAAGWISDVVFKGSFRLINALMLILLGTAMAAFFWGGNFGYLGDFLLLAAIGFCVEGPQSILGRIASVDVGGSARVASAAAGLVGIAGYFGATLSSVGTGLFLDRFGWLGGFSFWIGCAVLGFLLCVIFWKPAPKQALQ